MTRVSCHRFHANQVRLWLSVNAYNLGNLWRRQRHNPPQHTAKQPLQMNLRQQEPVAGIV